MGNPRESKLRSQGCSSVFLLVVTAAAACFREHPGPLTPTGTRRWVCRAVPYIPAEGRRVERDHREMAAQKEQELREAGAGRIWMGLSPPVPGRGETHGAAGRGGWGKECFTPSKQ